jgi:energy-coupling factor transporter ATP-binding protein EcfA2
MSKREPAQTRQKRTKRVSIGTPKGSSLRAAAVRRKIEASERPAAPVEILIENVRCFAGRHVIPIRPLTVLVGENSSGKSTLLAALSIVSDSRFPFSPEFNQPPFSLGNFQTIATYKGPKEGHAASFSLGFTSEGGELPRDVRATYIWDHRRTSISKLLVEKPRGAAILILLPGTDEYEIEVIPIPTDKGPSEKFRVPAGDLKKPRDVSELYLDDFPDFPERAFLAAKRIELVFSDLSLTSAVSIAPIRTKPERTYDEAVEDFSPEGRHIPFVLARILSGGTDAKGKAKLLKGLKRFGEQSGLFKDIEIRDLGDQPGDPFQVMVTVAGRPANLLDVGYGVSQALPVVVQSILAAEGDLLLIQQPEVHLHPTAQAALGSFFVDMVGDHDKRFIVETHSDYILDRIRMEIADGKLPSEAFLILYLERKGTETTVYPITVDSLGNLIGVPPTYREFFLREAVNLLSRGE